ncbi:MAG TPA: DNA polymerase III subunit beta [Candidatus Evtepia faecavium]|nr:DNA polymerase III subunit beta [Candidatus Evtepia faecavium]
MKFSCEKALLQNAILTASRAVSLKSTIPALEGLLLEAQENGDVYLTGYNQETGIRSCFQAEVTETGSMVLPARLFGEIVRKMPDDVLLFQEESLKVHIACGMSEFDLMGIDPEDFPELPTVEYQNSLTLPQQTLRSMISQTLFAVSDDESRPVHTGSLFVVDDEGLTIVAVDGFRLALRREPVTEKNGTFEFVVPGASLGEVEKICQETDAPVEVHQGSRHILFKMESTILIARRLEGEFLAWRQAIPRNNPIKVTADTKQLLSCMERVSLIVSEKLKSPLRCTIGDGQIDITTRTAIGNAHDCCPVEGSGSGLEIGFNNRYMMDALKAASREKVTLEMSSPITPCIIVPAEGEENFLFMVLPVRLKADM